MSKPTKHPNTTNEGFLVDFICDDTLPPKAVQTHLRHLLLATELGDLVVVQCNRVEDNSIAYLICASVVSTNNKRKLLPICELPDTETLLTGFRPPLAVENDFVNPQHTGNYNVCLVKDPDELALSEVPTDSVH